MDLSSNVQSNAQTPTEGFQPSTVRFVKIKRHRDSHQDEAADQMEGQRKVRMRKLGKRDIMLFKSLAISDNNASKQSTKNENKKLQRKRVNITLPCIARMVHQQWKLSQHWLPSEFEHAFSPGDNSRKRAAKQLAIQRRIQKFVPYRKNAIEEDKVDYLITVFKKLHPKPEQGVSLHEELIQAYKLSTDEKERKMLRKNFAVIRAMVMIEEGIDVDQESSDEDSANDLDDYDYYLDDDASDFEQFLDEDGNLLDAIDVEVEDVDTGSADFGNFQGNDYPSDDCSEWGQNDPDDDEMN